MNVQTSFHAPRRALSAVLREAEKVFAPPASPPANTNETPHQKVFRLVGERKFEEAAKLAKRLIESGSAEGFLIYGNSIAYRDAYTTVAGKVKASHKGAFSEVMSISPEIAQAIIRNNPKNRKINSKGLADRLRDIADGRWELNGQNVIVAKTGELNDGQHRLWAVILSGSKVRSGVFFGAERISRMTVDTGIVRTGATRLGFLDAPNYALAAASVALLHKMDTGRDATATEKTTFYLQNEDETQRAIRAVGGQPKGAPKAAMVVAALILLRAGAPLGLVETFFAEVRGAGKPTSQKVKSIKLREAIIAGTFRGDKVSLTHTVLALYGEWRRGKKGGDVAIVHSMPEVVTF